IGLPEVADGNEHVWHLYVVRVQERERVQAALATLGIQSGVHYPVPVHLQPAVRNLGRTAGNLTVTESLAEHILSLPLFPELSEEQIAYVAHNLKMIVRSERGTIAQAV